MASPTRPIRSGKTTTAVQLLLLSLMEVGILIGVVHSCISGEQEALMKFKQGVEDPHNRLGSWIAGTNCCSWKGIGCDGRTGQVIMLDLRSESLRGEIDPSLCYSKQIQYLDMSRNNFSVNNLNFIDCFQELRYLNLSASFPFGTLKLPQQLGNLSKLHTLDLSSNFGLVLHDATWLGHLSALRYLNFRHVNLENSTNWIQSLNKLPSVSVTLFGNCSLRSLPQSLPLVNFTSLITLDLSLNCLETELPGWLFMIRNIEHLFLSRINCNIEGHIFPLAVGNLKKLKVLELSGNYYEGSIPQSIGALSSLERLNLSFNDFSGSISNNFFKEMKSLTELDISYNNFNGSIPTSLGKLSAMKYLSLHGNRFSGTIPTSLGMLSSLEQLDLSFNDFSGSISDNFFEKMLSLQEMDISSNNFGGSIPTSLGKSSSLRLLSLVGNSFIGLIPASLGNLQLLEHLDLSSNDFSGTIPGSLGNLLLLRDLDLSNNSLNGLIPTSIGKLRSLENLRLSINKFEGNIPESVCELSSLEEFNVYENEKMNGTLPHCIGQLGELVYLDIGGENFEIALNESLEEFYLLGNENMNGTLPHCIGQLGELQKLYIGGENFEIALNESHFANMTNLKELEIKSVKSLVMNFSPDWVPPFRLEDLYIYSTKIGSEFPKWIRTQNTLSFLILKNTSIYGNLPTWIWDFSDTLESINLSNNNMSGELPHPKHPIRLAELDLSSNKFRGSTWLNTISEMMPELLTLCLAQNDFSGNIPISLCKLFDLYDLDLSENNFSGEIPNCLTYLFILSLANNNLHGKLPSPVENQNCGMRTLRLANNELSGTLPPSWKDCLNMVFLDLGRNKLSGDIPIWLMLRLQVLRLRDNNFFGNIPPELSKLTSLQVLDFANNNFSGIIPHTFGNFTAMKSKQTRGNKIYSQPEYVSVIMKGTEMKYFIYEEQLLLRNIDLSYNNLSGEIPRQLGELIYLNTLNLSHNYLTSSIPSTLGKLRELETLDLSRNHLSGDIPQQITTLDSLNSVNFSYNNLSGKIPTSNHFDTIISNLTFLGNPNLCGYPTSTTCGNDQETNDMGDEERHDDRELLWVCISIVFGFGIGFWIFYGILIFSQAWRYKYFQLLSDVNYKLYKCLS